ncbi:hypothetical protein MHU86_4736 [Fragilaria crotonensis]|nr:hypothetical protein MHU86_4736 [Fragilaria crotonensis]
MAAPSQTSPNQASKPNSDHAPDDGSLKPPPCPPEAHSEDNAQSQLPQSPLETQPTPTYESTEASDTYLLAKSLMQAGDFDSALETIGMAMGEVTSQLAARDGIDEEDAAIHPALAPLYYLYGTTLLYTIEESSDTLQAPDPLTNNDNDNEDEDGDNNGADDTQIAWENLETARMIISTKMIHTTDMANSDNDDNKNNNKLKLDLAQIHLRLGDLQRANGRYQDSVTDYLSCLALRLPLLGPYDRKVADTQYNLGLVYMLLAAEGDRQQPQPQYPSSHDPENEQPIVISPKLREEYRAKALVHYLGAAKAFAGQIAFLTGRDPDEIVNISSTELSGKTTGMDPQELNATAMSATLAAIRTRVAQQLGSVDVVGGDYQTMETIQELKEILDEIQETMDEAESAKVAIEQVSELKLKAQAAAEGDGGEVINMDGSTTTIGFGTSNASVAAAAVLTISTQVDASAAAGGGGGQPMMVVRKKKKRDDEDSKLPATENDQILKKTKSNDP